VENTAEAAPPKSAAPEASTPSVDSSALDRILEELILLNPGLGLLVLLLVILALVAFYIFVCKKPAASTDVENPAPRGSADGLLPAP